MRVNKDYRHALRLRINEHLSLTEISDRTGVAKSTLSEWLRDYPLAGWVREDKNQKGENQRRRCHKDRGTESALHKFLNGHKLDRAEKGRVAEAAVALRLALIGYRTFKSVAEGDAADFLVVTPDGTTCKIQVKWARLDTHGLPVIPLRRSKGERRSSQRYAVGEFDVIVGYDLFTDIAYIFTEEEVKGLSAAVTVCPDAAEAWYKLTQ